MTVAREQAVWFPAVGAGTGTDVFTTRLAAGLRQRGIRAEITWLPLRAEYAPWAVPVPKPPEWATVAHVSSWLSTRFIPDRLPVVATIHHAIHDPALRLTKGFARAAYHRFWIAPRERRTLRRADRVVAVSRFVADTAHATLLDVPVEVIYNGIDIERFRPGNRTREPGSPLRLLYVGGWRTLKGVDLLPPIMRTLGDGFELRYTGGPAAERDKSLMPSNMHDIGRLQGEDAVIAALQDADALLLPSRSEGFGLAAAEAMACGLPVIATRASSLVELVEDGVTGILCPQNDVESFVSAVRRLATDIDLAEEMACAARRRVTDVFSAARIVDAYIHLYERCVAWGASDSST